MKHRDGRRHRLAALLLVAALAAVVVAGCGSSSNTTTSNSNGGSSTQGSSGKHVSIAFLNSAATTYSIAMNQQSQQTANADNLSVTDENANFDPSTQLAQCQTAISQHKYQGLLIYPVSNAAIIPCVHLATQAGVKVAAVEGQIGPKLCTPHGGQTPGVSLEVYFCPSDLGNNWAKAMVSACANKNPCNVAVFTGPPSYALVPQELAAFEAGLKHYPNAHVKIIAHYAPGYDEPTAANADTKTLMLKDPQTNVIIEDDDVSGGGVAQALQELGKTGSVKLVGDDAPTQAIQRIKAGTEFETVINTPKTDTDVALRNLADIIRGKHVAQTEIDSTQISPLGKGVWIVTKSNANKFNGQFSG